MADPLLGHLTQWAGLTIWLVPALVVILIEIRAGARPALSAPGATLVWLAADAAHDAVAGKLLLGLGGPQPPVRRDEGRATYRDGVARLRPRRRSGAPPD
jgi:hypothetical protein